MVIFILLLLGASQAAAQSVSSIPLIDGEDRSEVFLSALDQFHRHRLHTTIIDTVHNDVPTPLPTNETLTMCLKTPDERRNDDHMPFYLFHNLTQQIVEFLGCEESTLPEDDYCLEVNQYKFQFDEDGSFLVKRQRPFFGYAYIPYGADYSPNPFDELMVDLALERFDGGNMIVREGCKYERVNHRIVRLMFKLVKKPKMGAGWIVERVPIGVFHNLDEVKMLFETSEYGTNFSYVDSASGEVFDVKKKVDDSGNLVWSPVLSLPVQRENKVFPDSGTIVQVRAMDTPTITRRTSSGMLISTLSKEMTIVSEENEYVLHLNTNTYFMEIEDRGMNAKKSFNVTLLMNGGRSSEFRVEGTMGLVSELHPVQVGKKMTLISREVKMGRSSRRTVGLKEE